MIPLWLLIVFFLCAVLYFFGKLNESYWRERDVPACEATWLLGSYKDIIFATKNMGLVFQDMYKEHVKARYAGYLKLRQPCLLLRDPALVKAVLVSDFASFADNDVYVDKHADPLFGNNPFVLRGEEWKRARGHFTPTAVAARLKTYFPAVLAVCDTMTQYVERQRHIGSNNLAHLETKQLAGMFTTDVIANAVFGIENNTFENPNNTLASITESLFESTFMDNIKNMILIFFPQCSKFLRIRFTSKKCEEVLISITKKVLKHRLDTGETRNDFFQQMIQYKQNDKLGVFTDEYIAAQCFGFLGDGYETSSDVICFTLFELAWHQDIQDRLRQELNDKLQENEGKLTFDATAELKYLDMVVAESLRMHPPAMLLTRVCTKPYILPPATEGSQQLQVAAGTPVTIPIYGLHMDPQHFPNPHKFDPERFTPEAVAARDKYVHLPFGEGPRQCLGIRFANMQVKASLVALVTRFRVKPSPQSGYPIGIDPKIFLKRPLNGAWVHFDKL